MSQAGHFAPTASIIDLPAAVAVDTLFLPFDIYELRKRRAEVEDEQVDE